MKAAEGRLQAPAPQAILVMDTVTADRRHLVEAQAAKAQEDPVRLRAAAALDRRTRPLQAQELPDKSY
jgi:hypothetical protein